MQHQNRVKQDEDILCHGYLRVTKLLELQAEEIDVSSVEISVDISTLNSSKTLKKCLESILDHAEKSIEVTVVDCGSSDDTVDIARKFGCLVVVDTSLRTLGQRRKAVEISRGKYCLILDSDQVIGNGVLDTLCSEYQSFDMVILGERSLSPQCILARLADVDRMLSQDDVISQKDPLKGMLIPRFYRRDILLDAFNLISTDLDSSPSGWVDAIVYSKASMLSRNVGYFPDSVFHQDRCSLREFATHYFEFGKFSRTISSTDQDLMKLINSKLTGRILLFRRDLDFKSRVLSLIYMIIKGSPYLLGTWWG